MNASDELRKALSALYLEVDATIADDLKAKAEAVLDKLEEEQFYIECLQSGGVDNWDWYGESLGPYFERYG